MDLSENAPDNRYPITNDFGLLYNNDIVLVSHPKQQIINEDLTIRAV